MYRDGQKISSMVGWSHLFYSYKKFRSWIGTRFPVIFLCQQKSCLNSSPDGLSLWDDWRREKDGHKHVLVLSEIWNREGRNEIREDKGSLRGKLSLLRGAISRNLGPITYRVHQIQAGLRYLSPQLEAGSRNLWLKEVEGVGGRREEKAEIERERESPLFLANDSQCEIHETSGREIHSSE